MTEKPSYLGLTELDESRLQADNANFDKAIAELRLTEAKLVKSKAEYQANWYEHAPFSWYLRKTILAFNNAVSNRLTGHTHNNRISFDLKRQVSLPAQPSAKDIERLAASYRKTVYIAGNSRGAAHGVMLKTSWLVYRAVRKVAKLVFRPALKRVRR